jgi:hypothetical protein
MKYFMRWRESFDDQEGWFSLKELNKEIKRIEALIDDNEAGEATIYCIIKGEDVTNQFV